MMDHLLSVNLFEDIKALEDLVAAFDRSDRKMALAVDCCNFDEMQHNYCKLQLILPTWIHRLLLIADRIINGVDLFSNLFLPLSETPDLQEALCEELSDVYQGLRFHRQAAACTDFIRTKAIFLLQAKKWLKAATLCNAQAYLTFVEIQNRDNRITNLLDMFTISKDSLADVALWQDGPKATGLPTSNSRISLNKLESVLEPAISNCAETIHLFQSK